MTLPYSIQKNKDQEQRISQNESNIQTIQNDINAPEYTPELSNTLSIWSAGTGYDENGQYLDMSSSVEEGQVSVGLKGQTRTNLVPTFDSGEWVLPNNTTIDNAYKISVVADGTSILNYITNIQVKPNTDYIISMNHNSEFAVYNSDASNYIFYYQNEKSVTFNSGTNNSIRVYLRVPSTETTGTFTFENVMLEEGTELGNFITGTKSTLPVRIKSVGKNLFDKSKFVESSDLAQGEFPTGTDKYVSDLIPVKANTTYTRSSSEDIGSNEVACYDINRKYIGRMFTETFTTLPNTKYVRSEFTKLNDLNQAWFQLEEGSSATTFEKYKESISYIYVTDENGNVITLDSLPNGTKDEVKVVNGQHVLEKNTWKKELQSSDIVNLITGTTNIDYVRIVKPSDSFMKGNTGTSDNSAILEGYIEKQFADNLDNEFTVDFGQLADDVIVVVPKGYYTDLAEAQADLAGTPLIYQLETPVITELDNITPLTAYPNGTIMVEPFLRKAIKYDATNGNGLDFPYPVIDIEKIEDVDGNVIDESSITLSDDGTYATISTATDGEVYTVYAPIKPEYSTIPETVMSYVTNSKGQIASNNAGIQQLSGNVLDLQDQVAILMVMNSN